MAEVHQLSEWRRQAPEAADEPVIDIEPVEEEISDPPPGPQGPDLEQEARDVRQALMSLILADREQWRFFEAACQQGLIGLPERAGRLVEALQERDLAGDLPPHVLQDAMEVVVPELAVKLLPDSAAASWEKLLERVRREQPGWEEPLSAILRLSTANPRVFRRLTHAALREADQAELVAAAQEVWIDLRERGHRFEPRGFSDHVWEVLRVMFPSYPGAAWDAGWASGLRREVYRDLARHADEASLDMARVDDAGVEAAVERMRETEKAGDRVGYREAARRAVHAGRKAVREAAGSRG